MGSSDRLSPVNVVIRPGTYDVEIKVSDKGGGIKRRVLKQVWGYGISGQVDQSSASAPGPMGGYGIGLPLAKLYARYFGGDLVVSSVYGFGTDVSIRLNRVGDHEELGSYLGSFDVDALREH